MKILKKGNYFKAYATVDNENGTIAKVGDSLGSISIKTGKFVGATACLIELTNHLNEYKKKEQGLLNQYDLAQEVIAKSGINIVTCGNCGSVNLHRLEDAEITCMDCKFTSEPCDFPDLFCV